MDKTSHVTHQEQDNSLYTLYYNYNKPNKGNYLIYQYKKNCEIPVAWNNFK